MSQRINLSKQLEKAIVGGQLLTTDISTKEVKFLPQGTTGQVLVENTVTGASWGSAGVGNARNGSSVVSGFIEHGLSPFIHETVLPQGSFHYRIYGNRQVQIGINPNAVITDADFPSPSLAAFDNAGRLTVFNAPKTDGSGENFANIYMRNNSQGTLRGLYEDVQNNFNDGVPHWHQQFYTWHNDTYGVYAEIRPTNMCLRGEYLWHSETRGGYSPTLAGAVANSLASRNLQYVSAAIDLNCYGNSIGLHIHKHFSQADTINTNPAYFGQFYSGAHQEIIRCRNDTTVEVAPYKFINTGDVVNTLPDNANQFGNDGVFSIWDNSTSTFVNTLKISRFQSHQSGAALAVDQWSVNNNSVQVFRADVVYPTERRSFVVKSNGQTVVNALGLSPAGGDQITGTGSPYSMFHVQGMISGPSNVYTVDHDVDNTDFICVMNTFAGNIFCRFPNANAMKCSPYVVVLPNGGGGVLTIKSAIANQIQVGSATGSNYAVPAGKGVVVTQVGGFWHIRDLDANGVLT